MTRILLVLFIIDLFLNQCVFATNDWTNATDNRLWSDAGNWTGAVPGSGTEAVINDSDVNGPTVDYVTPNVGTLRGPGYGEAGTCTLDIVSGGHLTISGTNNWFIGRYTGSTGIVTIEAGGEVTISQQRVQLGPDGGVGILNMNGGILTMNGRTNNTKFVVNEGSVVHLNSGLIMLDDMMSELVINGQIDVNGGMLQCIGDMTGQIEDYEGTEIVAYGGRGVLVYDYDVTRAGYTTVRATINTAASNPVPCDGYSRVLKDAQLSWKAGFYAKYHDIYLGTDFNEVTNATDPNTGPGCGRQLSTSFDPGMLETGQTYYWRVDEVNEQYPASPWRGGVWSFTVLQDESILTLENSNLGVEIDRDTGGIAAIEDKSTGERYIVYDSVFSIEVGTEEVVGDIGTITAEDCSLNTTTTLPNGVVFGFVNTDVEVDVTYTMDSNDEFALKKVDVRFQTLGNNNVSKVELFNMMIDPAPVEPIPYYGFGSAKKFQYINDGEEFPPFDNSTAFFLRYQNAGLFTALTCDYVYMKSYAQETRYSSIYWPGAIIESGGTFESEYGIIGVYQRKGYFHKPLQPTSELQNFLYPAVDTRLDRGEVEAISAAVQKFIKPGVYAIIVNGWGLGLPRLIEDQAGVDLFKNAIDTLSTIPEVDGLHFVHGLCGLSREFRDDGLSMEVAPNPYAEEVFEYALQKGVGLSPFIGICNNYPMHKMYDYVLLADQHLLSMDSDYVRRPQSIAISSVYADFLYETISSLKALYPHIIGQTYDFLSVLSDYDPNHCYLPGRGSFYGQCANVRNLNQRLRSSFPDLMLRGQIGWRELGPWVAENISMCHNAVDHWPTKQRNFLDFHIDHHFANNIRLSNWFANNCKMCPRHKMNANSIHNGSVIRVWDYGAWHYAVLSQIASSQVFGALHNLPDEANGEIFRAEDKQFFEKWIDWQKAHADYYLLENELFGEPCRSGIDGYAYSNGSDSIVFLCNPTFKCVSAAVPINKEIHLVEDTIYTVKELYPQERYRTGWFGGVFAYDSLFVVDVPPQTVMVFEVKPDDPEKPLLLGVPGEITEAEEGFVVSNLSGYTGSEVLFSVRKPVDYNGPEDVFCEMDSQTVPVVTETDGDLLLGRVHFDGELIEPEIKDWTAFVDVNNGHLTVTAAFFVPSSAQTILENQNMIIPAAYDVAWRYDITAWLGWNRFIIYLPILPDGFKADDILDDIYEGMITSFCPFTAVLNGQPIVIHSNKMGGSLGRFSGFFIDASEDIVYGAENLLVLEMPIVSEDNFGGIYLPNLTRKQTEEFEFVSHSGGRIIDIVPQSQDAFIDKPEIKKQCGTGECMTINLELIIRADEMSYLDYSDIYVDSGIRNAIWVSGDDPRWSFGPGEVTRGDILLSKSAKRIYLSVSSDDNTMITIGSGDGACQFSLGELVEQWQQKGDLFDPVAMNLTWLERQATIAVEIKGEMKHKIAVREDLTENGVPNTPYVRSGNLNGDCKIDFADFAILANFWLSKEPTVDIGFVLSSDGIINELDMQIFYEGWLMEK